jgi:peptidoglycan/LPS O-acetylase OafA/YrhL
MNLLEIVGLTAIIVLVIGGFIGTVRHKNSPVHLVFTGLIVLGIGLGSAFFLTTGGDVITTGYVFLVGACLIFVLWLLLVGIEIGKRAEREKQAPKIGD